MSKKVFYQVFEISPFGGCHSVSKPYPTWLGCKRVRNRIALEHVSLEGYRFVIREVVKDDVVPFTK